MTPSKLERLRKQIVDMERDCAALRAAGITPAKLERLLEAKRRTYALLVTLAADLGERLTP